MSDTYTVPEEKKWPLAPEGMHNAVSVDYIDWGMEEYEGKDYPKMLVIWQLEEEDDNGKRYEVNRKYTVSLNEKANLTKDLYTWFKFTKPEAGTQISWPDLLIGKQCQIQIVHKTSAKGKTYANVASIVPLSKGMKGVVSRDYVRTMKRKDAPVASAKPKAEYDDDV